MITFTESERRAITYERKDSSFLFDLNSEWTIDAARQGNKTRFINHASTEREGLNCSAKVVIANGEHRIKFIALRNIKAGEELLFDYGKKFSNDHFNKKLETATGKKGVLVGKEALDALDGLHAENRASRKKMAAIRSSRAGGAAGRGKARKTAVRKKSDLVLVETIADPSSSESEPIGVGEVEVDEENEDDDEEEEEEEDGSRRGRPRRETRQPKRYTR